MVASNYISKYTTVFESGCKVICGPHAASAILLEISAEIALQRRVRLLDFGNRCDMYFAARRLRYLTRDPAAAMQNIRLQRAFTCYQAVNLLQQMELSAPDMPVIILDLLAPFLDENVQTGEILRLYRESVSRIHSLMRTHLLLIGVKPVPPRLAPDRVGLLSGLAEEFGMLMLSEPASEALPESPGQPSLF